MVLLFYRKGRVRRRFGFDTVRHLYYTHIVRQAIRKYWELYRVLSHPRFKA